MSTAIFLSQSKLWTAVFLFEATLKLLPRTFVQEWLPFHPNKQMNVLANSPPHYPIYVCQEAIRAFTFSSLGEHTQHVQMGRSEFLLRAMMYNKLYEQQQDR